MFVFLTTVKIVLEICSLLNFVFSTITIICPKLNTSFLNYPNCCNHDLRNPNYTFNNSSSTGFHWVEGYLVLRYTSPLFHKEANSWWNIGIRIYWGLEKIYHFMPILTCVTLKFCYCIENYNIIRRSKTIIWRTIYYDWLKENKPKHETYQWHQLFYFLTIVGVSQG